ncbi:MAG TPA: hypothetical protein VJS87_01120 [Solirubrobacterales bacterium]|nr:hypothetical protein [Solirubrobacterales bacterium]
MSDKIKRGAAALAALAALALGGAAIANATSGGNSDRSAVENEQADGSESNEAAEATDQPGDSEDGGNAAESADATDEATGDGDGELAAGIEQKARAAAERATGGVANGDVEPAEPADPVEDPNDQPTPKGAAYEVEITKDGQALKVFLDSSLKPIETQQDAG